MRRYSIGIGIILGLLLACVKAVEAEEVEEIEEVETVDVSATDASSSAIVRFGGNNSPQAERAIDILTARPTRAKSLLLVIDHRAWGSFIDENTLHNYFGLDQGMKVGLGLRYGIVDDLDVGLYRLNNKGEIFDTYEFDARFRFLEQERHWINAAARAGFSWFVQPDMGDASGFFGQLVMDRIFMDIVMIGAGFALHTNSSNDEKTRDDHSYSGAVLGYAELRIIPQLALDLEISASVIGYRSKYPVFSGGFKVFTHRHTFALLVTNGQYINADGIVSNTWRGLSNLVIGFQITREFNF